MQRGQQTFYRVPESPLARFGLAVLGILLVALSFVVGLFFLAVTAGLAVLGGIALSIRGWWLGRRRRRDEDEDLVEVEYRVVRRETEED